MSRYKATTAKGTEVAWGYDFPLQEYFLHEYNQEGECIFAIASHNTMKPHPSAPRKFTYVNSEILILMANNYPEIPNEHKEAIGGDRPF